MIYYMKDKIINWFLNNFEEHYVDMFNCLNSYDEKHINPYHEEKDVWVHTNMVIDEFIINNSVLDSKSIEIGILACLLHDIGKPLSRKENDENKSVSFFNHNELGVPLVFYVLKKYQEDFKSINNDDIINILIMIKLHQKFYQASKESIIKEMYLSFSSDYYVDMFIKLCESDNKGRISNHKPRLENIEKIRKYYGKRYNMLRKIDNNQLFITVGCSGSGKSTYLKGVWGDFSIRSFDQTRLDYYSTICSEKELKLNYVDFYKIAWDYCAKNKIPVEKMTFDLVNNDIEKNNLGFIDNLHLSKKARNRVFSNIKGNPKRNLIVFIPDFNKLIERNNYRQDKKLEVNWIIEQINRFSIPDFSEADSILLIDITKP